MAVMIAPSRRQFVAGTLAASTMLAGGRAFAQAQSVDIGTMAAGSSWYQYGIQMAQFLKDALPAGGTVNVRPYAAAVGNVKLINAGEKIQVGMTFSCNLRWARAKMTDVQDATAENVRALAGSLDQYYLVIVTKAGSGFADVSAALAAKKPVRFTCLQPGSLGAVTTDMLLRAHGIDEATLKSWGGSINRGALEAAASALVEDKADVWVQPAAVGHPKVQEIAYSYDVEWCTIADPAMQKMVDLGYQRAVLPKGSFDDMKSDMVYPGATTVLIVNKDMSDDLAYGLTKQLIDNAAALKEQNKALSPFDPKVAWKSENIGGVPLHPGAERAYREAGMMG
ncbi:TAXI family TRAP transporter solute-binding subunit [Propylenella binzhouense]|uniref:TAXI family TRAP transporter solute-binding subunit n=1 Tax=Propylenella binzhouense TaxID=2555902 RepID=A0A964T281_9HYPH|nr:TAXI family TRAP transporter solute-binding subunit [Propylenella binzhouense]MYZ47126.1 TAXI family TRAP transporter solute-binding subunit [Propylenella binzhouense]